jgi:protein-S-isoprenylcysteine O-methyltransferase Ste14
MNIWQHITRQAQKEYSAGARLAAIGCAGLIFVFGIPAFLFWLASVGGDKWRFKSAPALSVLYLVLAATGLLLAFWTVWEQFCHARGTPLPIMATKKLLTNGPFALCRNPMALGAILLYSGISLHTASFAAVLGVLFFAAALIAYIKLVEEKEMAMRFGDEYVRYKQNTPFIIPRLRLLNKKSRE